MSSVSDLTGNDKESTRLDLHVQTLDSVLVDELNGSGRRFRGMPQRSTSINGLYDYSATSDDYKYFDQQERLFNSSPCDNLSISEQSDHLEKLQSRLEKAISRTASDTQGTISRHRQYLGGIKAKNENLEPPSKPIALRNGLQQAIQIREEAFSKRCGKLDVLIDSNGTKIGLAAREVTRRPPRRELRATKSAEEFTNGVPVPPERRSRRSTSALGLCPPPVPNRRALGPIGLEVKRTVSFRRARRFDSLGSSSHHSYQSLHSWCSGVSSLGMDSYSERSESSFASLSRTLSQESSRFLPATSVDTVLRSDRHKLSDEMPPRRPSRCRSPDATPRRPTRFRSPSPPR